MTIFICYAYLAQFVSFKYNLIHSLEAQFVLLFLSTLFLPRISIRCVRYRGKWLILMCECMAQNYDKSRVCYTCLLLERSRSSAVFWLALYSNVHWVASGLSVCLDSALILRGSSKRALIHWSCEPFFAWHMRKHISSSRRCRLSFSSGQSVDHLSRACVCVGHLGSRSRGVRIANY